MTSKPDTAPDESASPPPDPTDSPTAGDRDWSNDQRTVHQRIADARRDLPGIAKDSTGDGVPYRFRSIEAVKAALGPILGRHGVHYVATKIARDVGEVMVSGKPWRMIDAEFTFTIYGANGDCFEALAFGEGRDNADKVHNKMHTGAEKNLLLGLFCIGDVEPDPDRERPETDAGSSTLSGAPRAPWGSIRQAKFALLGQITAAYPDLDRDTLQSYTAAAWEEVGLTGEAEDLVSMAEAKELLGAADQPGAWVPVVDELVAAAEAARAADNDLDPDDLDGNGVDVSEIDSPHVLAGYVPDPEDEFGIAEPADGPSDLPDA